MHYILTENSETWVAFSTKITLSMGQFFLNFPKFQAFDMQTLENCEKGVYILRKIPKNRYIFLPKGASKWVRIWSLELHIPIHSSQIFVPLRTFFPFLILRWGLSWSMKCLSIPLPNSSIPYYPWLQKKKKKNIDIQSFNKIMLSHAHAISELSCHFITNKLKCQKTLTLAWSTHSN